MLLPVQLQLSGKGKGPVVHLLLGCRRCFLSQAAHVISHCKAKAKKAPEKQTKKHHHRPPRHEHYQEPCTTRRILCYSRPSLRLYLIIKVYEVAVRRNRICTHTSCSVDCPFSCRRPEWKEALSLLCVCQFKLLAFRDICGILANATSPVL